MDDHLIAYCKYISCSSPASAITLNGIPFLTDCMYGTYGIGCGKTCHCKAGGICDRETGACLTFKFFTKIASKLKTQHPNAGKRLRKSFNVRDTLWDTDSGL
jgi:hypothetical protein